MNKRGDVFQQQFNRAVFATSGEDMLPSLTHPTHLHADGMEEKSAGDGKPGSKLPTFKYLEDRDFTRASPILGT